MNKSARIMFKLLDLIVIFVMTFGSPMSAMAYTWTDPLDAAPGSVVTIYGDNSDGAGYLPGERVSVIAMGPNAAPYDFTGPCLDANGMDPEVAADGNWSCTITLPADPLVSVGIWTYKTLGSVSGYSEMGSFTDALGNFSKPYAHWSDEPLPGDWNNNILNDNKSNYFEGEVIPHVFMYGASNNAQLVNGESYSFNVTYNYYQQNTDAGGFAYMTQYNLSRQPHIFDWATPAITPNADSDFTNDGGMAAGASFYTVDANITSISVVTYTGNVGDTRDGKVTITFTYTGATTGSGYAAIYYGLYVAKPGEVPDQGKGKTNGANAWSGGSLQTTVDIGGSGATSIQLAPSAVIAGEISGLKFNDLNGNGTKDTNELGLAGWTICLDSDSNPNNGNLGCVLTSNGTTDDQDGNGLVDPMGFYYFSVTPGTYYVYEVNQNGWTQTTPSSIYYGPLVVSATTPMFLDMNFGNSYDQGYLKITKVFDPKTSGFIGTFDIVYNCGAGDVIVQLAAGQSTTVGPFATGTSCTVSEPKLPVAPKGWTFGTPVISPEQPVTIGNGTTVEVTVTNSITRNYNADLTVTKTATPSFTRTFTWDITKEVDGTKKYTAGGGPATFNYTVGVTHDTGTDTGFAVSGVITVANSNDFDIEGVNITDTIDNGGTCTVTDGTNVTVPATSSVDRNYSCTFVSNPGSGTNTAKAEWDAAAYYTPNGSATGTAGYAFVTPTTIVDGSVEVTDSLFGKLGTVSYTDTSPKTFTYSLTFNDPAGTCTSHTNTATFTTNTTGTTGSASQTVTDCQGADLTVSKTADWSFTRTYTWGIDKSVDDANVKTAGGAPHTFNYTVAVTHDAGTDSAWQVTGTITVHNPNTWESVTLTGVSDLIDNGGNCTVSGNKTQTIAAGGDSTGLTYTCTYASAPSLAAFTNTATATWDKDAASTPNGSASGTATGTFGAPTTIIDGSVTVSDPKAPSPPLPATVSYTDPSPTEFKYSLTYTDPAGTCTSHENTATIETNTTKTKTSDSVTVSDCQGADLIVSKTAIPTFTRTWDWTITKDFDATYNLFAGTSVTHGYKVTVTPNFTDSAWQVTGLITVTNPNDWEAITADITDVVDNGGTCKMYIGIIEVDYVIVPPDSSKSLTYTCTWESMPTSYTGTNTATVIWDKDLYATPSGTASGSMDFEFTNPTEINPVITVDDSNLNDEIWSADRAYAEWTYDKDFACSTNPEDYKNGSYSYTVPNTATITETKQSDDASVTINCSSKDLVVTKSATPSYTRTFDWTIDKSADKLTVYSANGGESEPVNYTIAVVKNAGTDSLWAISGTITVHNPNPFKVTGVSLSDSTPGGNCTVTPATVDVEAEGNATAKYTCTFTSNPGSGTNTATADWFENDGSGTADYTFGAPTALVNDEIDVTDTNGKSWHFTGSGSQTYQMTFTDPAGVCTSHTNTATIDQLGKYDSVTVEDCQGVDLKVSKTVTTAYTRTFTWTINKSVDKTKVILEGKQPQSATFLYTVAVSHDDGTDSAWLMSGKITVTNPNDWQAITADVTDFYDGGGTCTVTGGDDVVVEAGKSVELSYSCVFSEKPAYTGKNTATVVWDKDIYHTPNGKAEDSKDVNFGAPTTIVDGEVTVTDTYAGTLGTVKYTDLSPMEFTYSRTIEGTVSQCVDYDNTATFTTNTTKTTGSSSKTVTVCESQLNVLKLTKGVIDPNKTWNFNLYAGPHANDPFSSFGSVLASDSSLGKVDGILNFGNYSLDPTKTYTFCETNAPSGWASLWTYNNALISPYNPDRFPTPSFSNGQDLGNRCFDFGAGTAYAIPEGGTITFTVDNRFPGGEPRTIGFWKNWNTCTGGGQAVTATKNAGYDGLPTDPAASIARVEAGYFLLDDVLNPPGIKIGSFQIPASNVSLTMTIGKITVTETGCQIATDLLSKYNWFTNKNMASDAAYGLAAQLIAAKANLTAGAKECVAIDNAILQADTLLSSINFNGTKDYLGPKVKGDLLTKRNQAISIANTIDQYNNGMLCP